MKTLITILVVLAALAAGALWVAYSGVADVSAIGSQKPLFEWFLVTTREHSVESRAEKIRVPDLNNPARLTEGLEHYHTMCAGCHGAPGLDASEIGRGLNPTPPNLVRHKFEGGEAAEAFWVIQNGIRMTGMPAFGPTHTDEQIWNMVAFLRRMHELSPEQYAEMVAAAGLSLHESEGMEDHDGEGEMGEAAGQGEHADEPGHGDAG